MAEGTQPDVLLSIGGDLSQLRAQLQQLRRELAGQQIQVGTVGPELARDFKNTGSAARDANDQLNLFGRNVGRTRGESRQAAAEIRQLAGSFSVFGATAATTGRESGKLIDQLRKIVTVGKDIERLRITAPGVALGAAKGDIDRIEQLGRKVLNLTALSDREVKTLGLLSDRVKSFASDASAFDRVGTKAQSLNTQLENVAAKIRSAQEALQKLGTGGVRTQDLARLGTEVERIRRGFGTGDIDTSGLARVRNEIAAITREQRRLGQEASAFERLGGQANAFNVRMERAKGQISDLSAELRNMSRSGFRGEEIARALGDLGRVASTLKQGRFDEAGFVRVQNVAKELGRELKNLNAELKQTKSSMSEAELASRAFTSAGKKISGLDRQLNVLPQKDEVKKAAADLAALRAEMVKTGQAPLGAKLAEMEKAVSALNLQFGNQKGLREFGLQMERSIRVGTQFALAYIGIRAVLSGFTEIVALDKQMTLLGATLVTTGNGLKLSGQLFAFAKEQAIEFGLAPSETVAIITELNKALDGNVARIKNAFVPALVLTTLKEVDRAKAIQTLIGLQNNFGETMERTSDIILRATLASVGSVDDFLTSLRFIGPAAAQAGIPLEQVVAVLAVMRDNMSQASQSGTGLSSAIRNLEQNAGKLRTLFDIDAQPSDTGAELLFKFLARVRSEATAGAQSMVAFADKVQQVIPDIRAERATRFITDLQQIDKVMKDLQSSTGLTVRLGDKLKESLGASFNRIMTVAVLQFENLAAAIVGAEASGNFSNLARSLKILADGLNDIGNLVARFVRYLTEIPHEILIRIGITGSAAKIVERALGGAATGAAIGGVVGGLVVPGIGAGPGAIAGGALGAVAGVAGGVTDSLKDPITESARLLELLEKSESQIRTMEQLLPLKMATQETIDGLKEQRAELLSQIADFRSLGATIDAELKRIEPQIEALRSGVNTEHPRQNTVEEPGEAALQRFENRVKILRAQREALRKLEEADKRASQGPTPEQRAEQNRKSAEDIAKVEKAIRDEAIAADEARPIIERLAASEDVQREAVRKLNEAREVAKAGRIEDMKTLEQVGRAERGAEKNTRQLIAAIADLPKTSQEFRIAAQTVGLVGEEFIKAEAAAKAGVRSFAELKKVRPDIAAVAEEVARLSVATDFSKSVNELVKAFAAVRSATAAAPNAVAQAAESEAQTQFKRTFQQLNDAEQLVVTQTAKLKEALKLENEAKNLEQEIGGVAAAFGRYGDEADRARLASTAAGKTFEELATSVNFADRELAAAIGHLAVAQQGQRFAALVKETDDLKKATSGAVASLHLVGEEATVEALAFKEFGVGMAVLAASTDPVKQKFLELFRVFARASEQSKIKDFVEGTKKLIIEAESALRGVGRPRDPEAVGSQSFVSEVGRLPGQGQLVPAKDLGNQVDTAAAQLSADIKRAQATVPPLIIPTSIDREQALTDADPLLLEVQRFFDTVPPIRIQVGLDEKNAAFERGIAEIRKRIVDQLATQIHTASDELKKLEVNLGVVGFEATRNAESIDATGLSYEELRATVTRTGETTGRFATALRLIDQLTPILRKIDLAKLRKDAHDLNLELDVQKASFGLVGEAAARQQIAFEKTGKTYAQLVNEFHNGTEEQRANAEAQLGLIEAMARTRAEAQRLNEVMSLTSAGIGQDMADAIARSNEAFDSQIKIIRDGTAALDKYARAERELANATLERTKAQARVDRDPARFFSASVEQAIREIGDFYDVLDRAGKDSVRNFRSSLSDGIFHTLRGEYKDVKGILDDLAKAQQRVFSDFLTDTLLSGALDGFKDLRDIFSGQGPTAVTPQAGPQNPLTANRNRTAQAPLQAATAALKQHAELLGKENDVIKQVTETIQSLDPELQTLTTSATTLSESVVDAQRALEEFSVSLRNQADARLRDSDLPELLGGPEVSELGQQVSETSDDLGGLRVGIDGTIENFDGLGEQTQATQEIVGLLGEQTDMATGLLNLFGIQSILSGQAFGFAGVAAQQLAVALQQAAQSSSSGGGGGMMGMGGGGGGGGGDITSMFSGGGGGGGATGGTGAVADGGAGVGGVGASDYGGGAAAGGAAGGAGGYLGYATAVINIYQGYQYVEAGQEGRGYGMIAGTVVGTAVGAYFGQPGLGAAVGGQLGGMIGSLFDTSPEVLAERHRRRQERKDISQGVFKTIEGGVGALEHGDISLSGLLNTELPGALSAGGLIAALVKRFNGFGDDLGTLNEALDTLGIEASGFNFKTVNSIDELLVKFDKGTGGRFRTLLKRIQEFVKQINSGLTDILGPDFTGLAFKLAANSTNLGAFFISLAKLVELSRAAADDLAQPTGELLRRRPELNSFDETRAILGASVEDLSQEVGRMRQGEVAAVDNINEIIKSRYETELGFLRSVKRIADSIAASLDEQRFDIKLGGLTPDRRIRTLQQEFDRVVESIAAATDPDAIERIVGQGQSLVGNILGETEGLDLLGFTPDTANKMALGMLEILQVAAEHQLDLITAAVRDTDQEFAKLLEELSKQFGFNLLGSSDQLGLLSIRTFEATRALTELSYSGALLSDELVRFAGILQGVDFNPAARLAGGGFAPGYGNTDSVPALLTPGEFVVPKEMAQRERRFLQTWLRNGDLPGFATGGFAAFPSFAVPVTATAGISGSTKASGGATTYFNIEPGAIVVNGGADPQATAKQVMESLVAQVRYGKLGRVVVERVRGTR